MVRRVLRVLFYGLILLALASFGAALWARAELRGSLAQLDGSRRLAGLSAPVRVTRDALGIPTIQGASRADVARATGFLHAQDRFFQMDLARRRAAGELAALIGPRALALDREIRMHRFRTEARRAAALVEPEERRVLDAYTAGVNAGLSALQSPPFEYFVLRQDPAPWRVEDSFLVVLSMFVTLQDTDGSYEATLATMHEVLPAEMFEFMNPKGSEWDAPVVGNPFTVPALPGADVYDLRARRTQLPTPNRQLPNSDDLSQSGIGIWDLGVGDWELGVRRGDAAIGSNNFAVSGRLTADGHALIANDMHLGIRVPNTWYRAVFEWPDPARASEPHRLAGVTLPGVPAMVAGSNGHVAWGFTNTYADWSDIVLLEVDSRQPNRYRTPDGWKEFEPHEEVFQIARQPDQRETVRWTMWGPVLGPDPRGRMRAYRWVAHAADRLAASVMPFETARTLEQAFDVANGLGTPGQNMVAADRSGRIGWTVYGAIPRRTGIDGQLPSSWADGTRGWDGWLDDAEYPRIIDPPGGRLWTANARVVDGDMLSRLGDGGYEVGSRARIIRDRLAARERFTNRDLLAIQLDVQADFLSRWHELLERTLSDKAVAGHPQRATLARVVRDTWTGQASPGSAAYRFTRAFREAVSERVMTFVLADCYETDSTFDHTTLRRREAPIWKLVTEQPIHLLDPQYASWEELLLAAVDAIIEQAAQRGSRDLARDTWNTFNVVAYRHPLSAAIPFSSRWLDMAHAPLAGDLFTPRVHWGNIAASERMIVSPGREADGIMHMPTGQSGHPLSPFYANSHPAWVDGSTTPFLPGQAQHALTLAP